MISQAAIGDEAPGCRFRKSVRLVESSGVVRGGAVVKVCSFNRGDLKSPSWQD